MRGPYRDGDEAIRQRLVVLGDQCEAIVARRRDLEVELTEIEREIAAATETLGGEPRTLPRWCRVVAVFIATGLVAVVAVSAFTPTGCRRPKATGAQMGASTIRQATELYLHMDAETPACPTLDEVVAARKIDRNKTDDPWGRPYRIECAEDEMRVWSAGRDGAFRTADDIADHFRNSDLMRVEELD